jgi:hypothetical protein
MTDSPLPEDIAGLIESLNRLAETARAFGPPERTLHGKAAAALQRLAQENERLESWNRLRAQDIITLGQRVGQLEAERDALQRLAQENIKLREWARNLHFGDAIEAATIERCAQLCDGWLERFGDGDIKYTRPTEYASDAVKDIAEAIRALAKPDAANEESKP